MISSASLRPSPFSLGPLSSSTPNFLCSSFDARAIDTRDYMLAARTQQNLTCTGRHLELAASSHHLITCNYWKTAMVTTITPSILQIILVYCIAKPMLSFTIVAPRRSGASAEAVDNDRL